MAGVAVLLLTASAGYLVLERASGQRGRVKRVGEWVGSLVIVISFVALIARAVCLFYCPTCPLSPTKGKAWFKPGMTCPYSGRVVPAPAEGSRSQ